MNGLYGYPSLGSAAMGHLGDANVSTVEGLWLIANGAWARDLEGTKKEAATIDSRLNELRVALAKMPEGPRKQDAFEEYQRVNGLQVQTKQGLNRAIREHNDLAAKIKSATFGAWSPSQVGLSGAPAVFIAAVAVIAAVAAVTVGVSVIAEFLGRSKSVFTQMNEGIRNTNELVKSGGGVVGELGDTSLKVALAGGALLLGWLAFKALRGRKRSTTLALAAPAPVSGLKLAEGTVLA